MNTVIVEGLSGPLARLPSGLRRPLDLLASWRRRARERAQLREMSERLLRDIGVTRAQASEEAGKPFWRP
jgi:uncharacterized protein YjiS (DUF1127 family)